MADNVPITAGVGTPIATDEVAVNGGSTAHVQFVKLVDGASDGTTGLPGDSSGLWTVPRRDLFETTVTSAGLTTTATPYTAGDQMGTIFTVANAGRVSGGSGYITGVQLLSQGDHIGAVDVVFLDSSATLAGDNAAFTLNTSGDLAKFIGIVQLAGAYDLGSRRVCQTFNLALPYKCPSGQTSIYAALISRSATTAATAPFGAVTDLQLNVWFERN